MSSFSASSVVSAGAVFANRARWVVDSRFETSERPIRSHVQDAARPRGDDANALFPDGEGGVAGGDLEPAEAQPERRRETRRVERHAERPSLALRAGERAQAPRRERRLDVAEPDATGAVEQPLDPRCGRLGLRRGDDRSHRDDPELDPRRERAERAAQRTAVDAGPGSRLDDPDGVVADHDPGVPPRLGEPPVEAVRQPCGGHRRETVDEVHVRPVPKPEPGEDPSDGAFLEHGVDRLVDERTGTKLVAARRRQAPVRPDEADGARDPRLRGSFARRHEPPPRSSLRRRRRRPSRRAAARRARGTRRPRTAAASTAATPRAHAASTSALRARRRGRLAVERNGPDTNR